MVRTFTFVSFAAILLLALATLSVINPASPAASARATTVALTGQTLADAAAKTQTGLQVYENALSALSAAELDLFLQASLNDLEWADQLPGVPPYVRDHTLKHALAVSCFKYLVLKHLLAPRVRESWATDIRAASQPRIAILLWLANLPPNSACGEIFAGRTTAGTRLEGGEPVIVVILAVNPGTGLLAMDPVRNRPVPPITVFETTLEGWLNYPGVRCGIYNQFPMTVRLWPSLGTFECPSLPVPGSNGWGGSR